MYLGDERKTCLSSADMSAAGFSFPARVGRVVYRHFLPLGILFDAVVGITWPQPGLALHRSGALSFIIFAIFVCSGLSLDMGALLSQVRRLKAPVYAIVAVSGVFPVVGFVVGRVLTLPPGDFVGLMVVASSPTTLGSGIILSNIAGGSLPLAILTTIVCSMSAVVLMPTVLQVALGLGMRIDLPVGQMMKELGYLILLPTLIGQLLRRPLAEHLERFWSVLTFLPNLLVVMMIFIAISKGSSELRGRGLLLIAHVACVVLSLHIVMLGVNYTAGRIMRLPEPDVRTITLVASQKTLPLSTFVAMTYFAQYPTAVVPCLLFYLCQILVDSLMAHRWARGSRI